MNGQNKIDYLNKILDCKLEKVIDTAREVGFGATMHALERAWRGCLQENNWPVGGEFSVGPCVAFLVPCGCTEEKDESYYDNNGHCEWCCNARRVTERVRRAQKKNK